MSSNPKVEEDVLAFDKSMIIKVVSNNCERHNKSYLKNICPVEVNILSKDIKRNVIIYECGIRGLLYLVKIRDENPNLGSFDIIS